MVESLAYFGFVSPAAREWGRFGPEILGAQLAPHPHDAIALRIDEHAPRIIVHEGPDEAVAYLGWDCGDHVGFDAAVASARAAGFVVVDEPDTAAIRQVQALAAFTDPFGFRHELTHGFAVVGEFVPGRPMSSRFITGDQGLGHFVMVVPDLESALAFYLDTLDFRLSDNVEIGVSLRFLHCNPRHHTIALTEIPGMVGYHHLMVEVEDIDDVGRALDLVVDRDIPLAMGLGHHPNDHMTSFYVFTPSGFPIEYGTGGVRIDDATWAVETYDAISVWGHKPPAGTPFFAGVIRPVAMSGN